MSKVALSGNALGTGTVTLASPNTNSTVTLNLPATAGTVLIQDGTNTTTVVNLTATGTVNVGGGNISPQTGFKNRIINGAMTIDQRNAGASVATTVVASSTYTLDRWAYIVAQSSKFTVQQNAGSVTPPVGFTNYLGITSTSAYARLSSDYFAITQAIEGFNGSDLGWGTANASTVTLSFWVRSSLTGTFSGGFRNATVDRSYVFSYSINAANTWEYKTITIVGDTSGTWATNSGVGIRVQFDLGSGSTFQTTAGVWTAGNFTCVTGTTSVVGTSGATFYVTGVQLERGSVATPFEFRSIGTELGLCQRYYETGQYRFRGQDIGSAILIWNVNYKITKRATATLTGSAGTPGSSLNTIDTFSVQLAGSGTVDTGVIAYTASSEL
jgi:hypothetical protein